MGAYPNIPIGPPSMSGGVPQWFTKGGDQSSWFPGAPQFNLGLSQMLQSYGEFDPELNQLLQGLNKYGKSQRQNILTSGRLATTAQQDPLALQYSQGRENDRLASQGLESGSESGGLSNYASKMMGTTGTYAQAQGQASQVPGQMALAKQQIENKYRQNQIQGLKNMMDLITSAGQSQYGYDSAQLSADRGQIALDQAQNQEAMSNFGSVMSLLFGNQMPSLFGAGGNSAFGPGGGGGFASGGLSSLLGMFGGGGGGLTAADFGTSLAEAAPLMFA